MNASFWDHALVVIVLGLVFPFVGLWGYRRFLLRATTAGEPALIREYKQTIFVWLAGLTLVTLAAWLGQRRPIGALSTADRGLLDAGLAHGMAAGMALGILARPVLALVSRKAAAGIAESMTSLAPFLPKSRRALAWGLGVSLAAGVAEEVAYRGFLIAYFSAMGPTWVAIAASSLLFGAAHLYQGTVGVVATTALGAAFAVIYLSTGSLVLPVVLHALVDVSSMVTAYLVLRPSNARDGEVHLR